MTVRVSVHLLDFSVSENVKQKMFALNLALWSLGIFKHPPKWLDIKDTTASSWETHLAPQHSWSHLSPALWTEFSLVVMEQKVVLITGCSSGIGLSLAIHLASDPSKTYKGNYTKWVMCCACIWWFILPWCTTVRWNSTKWIAFCFVDLVQCMPPCATWIRSNACWRVWETCTMTPWPFCRWTSQTSSP